MTHNKCKILLYSKDYPVIATGSYENIKKFCEYRPCCLKYCLVSSGSCDSIARSIPVQEDAERGQAENLPLALLAPQPRHTGRGGRRNYNQLALSGQIQLPGRLFKSVFYYKFNSLLGSLKRT